MKYEAKNVDGVATSQAATVPWTTLNQAEAVAKSTATGGHLMTTSEWMTIAADLISVRYNWYGDTVDSNYMYIGHSLAPSSFSCSIATLSC